MPASFFSSFCSYKIDRILGFEYALKKSWGEKVNLVDNIMFDTLPWACKMSEIGKHARIFGTKDSMYGGASEKSKAKPHVKEALIFVQKCLGKFPELSVTRPKLGVLLSIRNVQIHPGTYCAFTHIDTFYL